MRICFALAGLALMCSLCGCDPLEIGKLADSLDRFGNTIDKTTADGGNLSKRITQLTSEMRQELVKAGKQVTEDAVIKFAIARQQTIGDILRLTQKLFGDTRILMREFQGGAFSIPLQFAESLGGFREDIKRDLETLIPPLQIVYTERNVPLDYSGVTWSLRPEGSMKPSGLQSKTQRPCS
jgi:hypothetical protein